MSHPGASRSLAPVPCRTWGMMNSERLVKQWTPRRPQRSQPVKPTYSEVSEAGAAKSGKGMPRSSNVAPMSSSPLAAPRRRYHRKTSGSSGQKSQRHRSRWVAVPIAKGSMWSVSRSSRCSMPP